jgi:hypothetical protein
VGSLATDEGANYGVDINTGGIADSFANFVWEPAVVKVIVDLLCFPLLLNIHAILISYVVEIWNIFCSDQCYKCCNRSFLPCS